MKIKLKGEWKEFDKIIKKKAECLYIEFDNCNVKCTTDHIFKDLNNNDISAELLIEGDILKNSKYGESKVIFIDYLGEQDVYTPLNVDGEYYETENGLINHNCSFLGSSCTLIDAAALEKLLEVDPIRYEENFCLKIFEDPIPGVLYVMGVDVASGVGGDYSVIQVLRIDSKTQMKQVAVFRDNKISVGAFSRMICKLSDFYNEAYYILENQDVGKLVAEELFYTLENYRLISTDGAGKALGTRATKRSKLDACMELKRLMNAGFLEVYDADTIKELSRFEECKNAPNVFKGAKGGHDDTVSGLYWAVYATLQPEIDMDRCQPIVEKKVEEFPADFFMQNNVTNNNFWSDF